MPRNRLCPFSGNPSWLVLLEISGKPSTWVSGKTGVKMNSSPPTARSKRSRKAKLRFRGNCPGRLFGYPAKQATRWTGKTKQKCQDPSFTLPALDIHYWRECPMLSACKHCEQVKPAVVVLRIELVKGKPEGNHTFLGRLSNILRQSHFASRDSGITVWTSGVIILWVCLVLRLPCSPWSTEIILKPHILNVGPPASNNKTNSLSFKGNCVEGLGK